MFACVFLYLCAHRSALMAQHGARAEHYFIFASLGLSQRSSKKLDPAGNGLGAENRRNGGRKGIRVKQRIQKRRWNVGKGWNIKYKIRKWNKKLRGETIGGSKDQVTGGGVVKLAEKVKLKAKQSGCKDHSGTTRKKYQYIFHYTFEFKKKNENCQEYWLTSFVLMSLNVLGTYNETWNLITADRLVTSVPSRQST